jgi:hypothetical protein
MSINNSPLLQAEELNSIVGNAFRMAYAAQLQRQPTFQDVIASQLQDKTPPVENNNTRISWVSLFLPCQIWYSYYAVEFHNSSREVEAKLGCVRFEVFTAVTMKTAVFWDVTPCSYCENRVSEERTVSIIRVKRIRNIRTLAVTNNLYIYIARSYLKEK